MNVRSRKTIYKPDEDTNSDYIWQVNMSKDLTNYNYFSPFFYNNLNERKTCENKNMFRNLSYSYDYLDKVCEIKSKKDFNFHSKNRKNLHINYQKEKNYYLNSNFSFINNRPIDLISLNHSCKKSQKVLNNRLQKCKHSLNYCIEYTKDLSNEVLVFSNISKYNSDSGKRKNIIYFLNKHIEDKFYEERKTSINYKDKKSDYYQIKSHLNEDKYFKNKITLNVSIQ